MGECKDCGHIGGLVECSDCFELKVCPNCGFCQYCDEYTNTADYY